MFINPIEQRSVIKNIMNKYGNHDFKLGFIRFEMFWGIKTHFLQLSVLW